MSKGCIITSSERYLGSMKPFSVSVIGFIGFVAFPKNPFVCPKEGIGPPILSYSFRMGLEPEKSCSIREGSGFLGCVNNSLNKLAKRKTILKKTTTIPLPPRKTKNNWGTPTPLETEVPVCLLLMFLNFLYH